MKRKLLSLIKMVSKNLLYGIIIQCIFLTSLMAAEGNAQIKPLDKAFVKLEHQTKSVQSLFEEMESKTDYVFVYPDDLLNNNPTVTLERGKKSVEEVLIEIAKATKLKFKQVNNTVYVGKNVQNRADAVEITIDEIELVGAVTDEGGNPLPGVAIVEKGTTNGTVTDLDGKYSISVQEGSELVVSYVGYKSQTVQVGSSSQLDIVLEEDLGDLEEVVVVGYGTQKKSTLTGSVTDLKADKLAKNPTTNVKGLLVGQVPGLVTNQNPGLPGSDNVDISIRGFGSPLVIVDGVESHLDRLDPNDIESISVLKDASAAIYGARAGNGVILVTTKRGTSGKPKVSYHGYFATQKRLTFPEQVDAGSFIKLGRDAVFNTQYDPANPNADISYGTLFTEENLEKYNAPGAPSYDWANATVKEGGSPLQNHNLSFRGGSENVKYYVSVGMQDQSGIFKGDYDYKKFSVTSNTDIKLSEGLDLKLNVSHINEQQDYASSSIGDIWNDLRTAQPIHPTVLPDPTKNPYSGFNARSPVTRINKDVVGYENTNKKTTAGAAELSYNLPFFKDLTVGARMNFRFRGAVRERLTKFYEVYSYNPDDITEEFDGYKLEGSQGINAYTKSIFGPGSDPRSRFLYRGYARYNKDVSKHNFSALAFVEREDNVYSDLSVTRRDLLSPDIPQVSGANELTITNGTGRDIEYTRISVAGRFNYSYDEKYLFEATLRADASSKFGPKVRWGYFPSVSAGWNIAREDFLKDAAVLDQLKLRLSYSQTGVDNNLSNTSFEYLTGFEERVGNIYVLNGSQVPQIQSSGLPNELVTWEETTLYNVGVDYTLFDGRVFGTFDGFYRYRDGLLRTPLEDLPGTFGAPLPAVNLDARSNRGFDASLGVRGYVGDFKYNIVAGVGYTREKYEKYQEDIDETDPVQVRFDKRTGRWVNTVFGYKSDGLFNTQAEVDEYLDTHTFEDINGSPKPGDIRYVDLTGDGVINREDRYEIGYGNDPQLTYSLQPSLTYKNFNLSMLWQGGSQFNVFVVGAFRAAFDNEQVPLKLHEEYSWIQDPANPGVGANPNAQLPAFNRDGARAWNDTQSDFWMKDGTYVRLKTATLSYTFSQQILSRVGVDRLSVYVSGDNIVAFNKLGIFKGNIDPEEASRPNAFNLPLLRTMSFGVQVAL
ncbi:SusC/RagA family TonB-linked outer membrane protein [Echinicola strongylocentroti]|uniref:SusC/RagA family TonB-linked outer membrane protein n=1 Tax=Echinicola strongylocentroti TaxID=1795355 RepID=A0A2Z4IKE9_9BACT|nr:TonB-dependent receptor [Echinicola strongylocentroti]AWW31602.1 SusC/RagA family TonB-linked outer membrane protein [Echinicola strongylocentroti]